MKLKNLPTFMLMATAMAGVSMFAASPVVEPYKFTAQSEDWNFRDEASQLLKQIQSTAIQLTNHAATLKSYAGKGLSWRTHAAELTLAKDQINKIGERLDRLQSIRHVAEPWHREAIDSIMPVAVDLAANTEAAIRHLKENRNYLWAPAYTDRLAIISERADQLKEYVDLHLELAGTQDKLEELRDKAAAIGS